MTQIYNKIANCILNNEILFVSLSPELYSVLILGKLSKYKVELKNMLADVCEYKYQLDNQFFEDLDGPEVQKGNVTTILKVRKTSGIYQLDFQTEGVVVVSCDRCLDDMEQPIESTDRLKVKLGDEYTEIDDIVVVPEEDGYINVAWFIYEFIALSIPMKHVHAPGKCNKSMESKLNRHLRVSVDEEDELSETSFETDADDEPREIDPRWNELKKILDNN